MSTRQQSLEGIVDAIVVQQSRKGLVPPAVIEYAASATLNAVALRSGPLTRTRVGSYFDAVVRRRLVRASGGEQAVAHLLIRSVVDDLRDSGRDARAIAEELERGWRNRLPDDVLDEWRSRLCA